MHFLSKHEELWQREVGYYNNKVNNCKKEKKKSGLLGLNRCLLTKVGLTKTEDTAICPVDHRLDNLCHCPWAYLRLRIQTQI